MRRYTKFEHLPVKSNPKKSSNPEIQMQTESEKVQSNLDNHDFVVVLDERGKRVTSFDMAHLLAKAGAAAAIDSGTHNA